MAVTSADQRWLEVNDRLCAMLGYSREELMRTTWAALTHADDLEKSLQFFCRLVAGEIEHFSFDKRYIKKDGSILPATIHMARSAATMAASTTSSHWSRT